MFTKQDLLKQLKEMPIDEKGTIIVHSSMKSIGDIEGGAETVLDAFTEFMKDGLLVFPTHTWATMNEENPVFSVNDTPSHVGILTEIFRKRPGVLRSYHPTHSVGALGDDADDFINRDEQFNTPAARESVWGKLLDRQAKILLVGVDLKRNTFIHGIEEWLDIPDRMNEQPQDLVSVLPDGTEIPSPQIRHISGISNNYWKVEEWLANKGAIEYTQFGDAKVLVCDTVQLAEYITEMLKIDPALFSDGEPLTEEQIEAFNKI